MKGGHPRKTNPLVVMGASLGGLDAVGAILRRLTDSFPAPIVVVLHRAADDQSRLVELLARRSALPVIEPNDRQELMAGTVYLGPADYHLLVGDGHVYFSTEGPENFARPSIDVLFEAAAEADFQPLVGVLLTASSEDGARGLWQIARAGGRTIVQSANEAKSAVAIRAAERLGAAQESLPLEVVPKRLVELFGVRGALPGAPPAL